MEKFVKVGDVICDPYCGSSTTGVIALEMECSNYIGIDKDQACIDISRSRLIDKIKDLNKKIKMA
jgi:site-specific DNA-methyltransferase (adenine-specific)